MKFIVDYLGSFENRSYQAKYYLRIQKETPRRIFKGCKKLMQFQLLITSNKLKQQRTLWLGIDYTTTTYTHYSVQKH